MNIAADFTQRVVVHSASLEWVASPMTGVDRRALERVGNEVARATSIVRYAPNSQFSSHIHTAGEEFVVLDGTFEDEHGAYPTGTYVRNPPGSEHTPGSKKGCVIFVKLWQFQPDDKLHVCLQINTETTVKQLKYKGVAVTQLFKGRYEEVSLIHFEADAHLVFDAPEGAELLVLEGEINEQTDKLVKHSWLRTPMRSNLHLIAGKNGAKIWFKAGHLVDVNKQINRLENA
jgi:anti-sigma factor ChrR (cupin superfamily)